MRKNQVVDAIKLLNTVQINGENELPTGIVIERSATGLVVSSSDHAFQTIRTNRNSMYWKQQKKTEEASETLSENEGEQSINILSLE